MRTLFRVVKVFRSDYGDGYQLTAAEHGTSIEHTFSFGTNHCYEVASPHRWGQSLEEDNACCRVQSLPLDLEVVATGA
jgi:hypothetical protein